MNRRRLCLASALLCLGGGGLAGATWAGLPETVEKNRASIVVVGTYKATANPRFQLRGTGFIVAGGQWIVTNAHVLPPATGLSDDPELSVLIQQGRGDWQMRRAELVDTDAPRDLALLRMQGAPGPALVLGDSGRVREGENLAFMGFPIGGALGYSIVTHRATVSSITSAALPSPTASRLSEQAIRGLRAGNFEIFQLDATAYPGNSGGPLFDPDTGEVVGVVNMVLIKSTREAALSQPSGIAYAIPGRYVKELLERHR